ncbi:hypothetical protein EBU71_20460 [bacterium]|nr:hypothetical protein [Candidatus Elulimicrobium humile]
METTIEEITNLYSYQGNYPVNPPQRIRLSSGLTKTDFSTFTKKELALNGWTGPYTKPSYNPELYNCQWSETELKFVLSPVPKLSPEALQGVFYKKREDGLKRTDWCVLPDSPLNAVDLEKIKKYRQELRDITKVIDVKSIKTQEDLDSIVWPRTGVSLVDLSDRF